MGDPCIILWLITFVCGWRRRIVGENEEVSIKQVTDAIVKALGFKGSYTVSALILVYTVANLLLLHWASFNPLLNDTV
jgi:hypothetical protein